MNAHDRPLRALHGLALLVALAPAAQRPAGVAPRPVAAPSVERIAADGTHARIPLGALGAERPTELGGVLLRFDGARRASGDANQAERAVVRLQGGDALAGRIVKSGGDDLELELLGGVRYAVSLDSIESLTFPAHVPTDWTSPLVAADEGDRLYRRQGQGLDLLDGTLEELTEDGLRFHGVLGRRDLPWSEVAALFVESLGDESSEPETSGTPVAVDLWDLSRLRGRLVRLDAQGLRLATHKDAPPIVLPLEAIATIVLDDGSVAFLSSLVPTRAEEGSPFGDELGMSWPHQVDRAVDGAPLVAGGRLHSRGLGVHAPSKLAWTLDGSWHGLLGSVAIDDQVLRLGARGSVTFRVAVDGKEVWQSPLVRGGDAPLPLPRIDLTGARELELAVDVADGQFVADRADWLGMLLVRVK